MPEGVRLKGGVLVFEMLVGQRAVSVRAARHGTAYRPLPPNPIVGWAECPDREAGKGVYAYFLFCSALPTPT